MQFGRNGRSLFYFCTGEGINLLPAEDEDLSVMEELGTLYLVTLYFIYSLAFRSGRIGGGICRILGRCHYLGCPARECISILFILRFGRSYTGVLRYFAFCNFTTLQLSAIIVDERDCIIFHLSRCRKSGGISCIFC